MVDASVVSVFVCLLSLTLHIRYIPEDTVSSDSEGGAETKEEEEEEQKPDKKRSRRFVFIACLESLARPESPAASTSEPMLLMK